MPLTIMINGAFGRMGQLACQTISAHPDFVLIAKLGREHNLAQEIRQHQPDIVVDLTHADAAFFNANTIIEANVSPVIGTSGLTATQIDQLITISSQKKLSGLIIPNFSISATLMMHYAAQVAHHFQQAEIIEMHHPFKKDAPSATAMRTAERLHPTPKIHSILMPGIVANQTVLFGNPAETFSIHYNTISRDAFMPGLILACQNAKKFDTILCGLEHCLDLCESKRLIT